MKDYNPQWYSAMAYALVFQQRFLAHAVNAMGENGISLEQYGPLDAVNAVVVLDREATEADALHAQQILWDDAGVDSVEVTQVPLDE